MQRGKFIVLEGLEGAGKSTLRTVIAQELTHHGIGATRLLREPGGTVLAEQLRALIKQGLSHEPLQDKAELLLLYAARVQLVEQVIKPALASGTWVISDRHDLSSQAYQGGGRAINGQLLTTLRDLLLGDFRPDLTFYLDISPEQGLQRAQQRGSLDRIERESLPFFQRTRQRYLELAQADDSIITIDASQPIARVCQAVQEQLALWLNKEPDTVCPGIPG